MNLATIMTEQEQDVITRLVIAHLKVQAAKAALVEAQAELGETSREVTANKYYADEDDQLTSTIPDSLVVYVDGSPYLVEIDTEGDNEHRVAIIGGVLGKDGAA